MVYKGKLSYFDKIHFVFRLFQLIQKNALFTDMKKQQTQDLEWCEICTPESILEMIIYKLPLPQFSFISKATTLSLYFHCPFHRWFCLPHWSSSLVPIVNESLNSNELKKKNGCLGTVGRILTRQRVTVFWLCWFSDCSSDI